MDNHVIKLSTPAEDWEHASPIGGGSFGAMLFGNTDTEKIYLCEESIWSGTERDTTIKDFPERVKTMRQMYLDGKITELDPWAEENLGEGIERIQSYEYAGVISLDFADKTKPSEYHRNLILDKGISEITYKKGSNAVIQTAFCSYPYELTVINLSSQEKTEFALSYERECIESVTFLNDLLLVRAKTACGNHRFAVDIKIETEGDIEEKDGKITVSGSDNTTIYISIATEFKFGNRFEEVCLDLLSEAEYEEIKEGHIEDFSELFCRSDIQLKSNKDVERMTTDRRLDRIKESKNAEDDGLYALYFAFGKYLLISSSREDTLPANLQGVWVEKMENPWNSDYHTNINLQMNYWLPEVANISECHLPLFEYMNKYLLESGKKTARENYNCRGTVLHHLSDIYGFTTPADGIWGVWPMGGAWLSFHLWEHFLYTNDE